MDKNNESDIPLLYPNGSTLSAGALSDIHHQVTAINLHGIQKWFRYLLCCYVPICLGVLIMSCEWANITGQKDNYNDISTQWQSCLTAADYSYIPLSSTFEKIQNQITQSGKNLQACFASATSCEGTACFSDLKSCIKTPGPIPIVNDIQIPNGYYLNGFRYIKRKYTLYLLLFNKNNLICYIFII